jgi:hypothetical protein
MHLITEVADLQARLERLRVGLRHLVEKAAQARNGPSVALAEGSVVAQRVTIKRR